MLNKVILMGRITQDLEVKQTPQGVSVLSFTVAVQRSFAKQGEERQSDFINCVAWRQQADFIGRYFGKGRMICLEGNLRTRTYDDKNGTKHYVTEVYVDAANFTGEPKQDGNNNGYQGGYSSNNGYQNNNNYQNNPAPQQQNNYAQQSQQNSMSIGDIDDFEEVISDDGVPF